MELPSSYSSRHVGLRRGAALSLACCVPLASSNFEKFHLRMLKERGIVPSIDGSRWERSQTRDVENPASDDQLRFLNENQSWLASFGYACTAYW